MHFVKEYNLQIYAEQPKPYRKKLRWIVAVIAIIAAVAIGVTVFFVIKKQGTKESNEKLGEHNLKMNITETINDDNIYNKESEENEPVDDNENTKNEIEKTQAELDEKNMKEEEKQRLLEKQRQREEAERLQEEERQRLLAEEKRLEEEKQRLLEEERLAEIERQKLLEEERLAEEEKQRKINEYNDLADQMKIINESHKNLMLNKMFAVKENVTLGDHKFTTKYGNNFDTTSEAIDINIRIFEQQAKDTSEHLLTIKNFLNNEELPVVGEPDYHTSKLLLGKENTDALIDSIQKQKTSGNIFKKFLNSLAKSVFVDILAQVLIGETMGNNVKQVDIDYLEQLILESAEDLKKFKEKAQAVINYFTCDFKDIMKPKYVDISCKLFEDLFEFKDDGTIDKSKPELNHTEIITDIHKLKTTQLYKCLKYNLIIVLVGKDKAVDFCKPENKNYNDYIKKNGFIKLTDKNLNSITKKDTKPVYKEIKQLITDVYKEVNKKFLQEIE